MSRKYAPTTNGMTNHIDEAKEALSDSDPWNNNAKAHALIAIAEQLQLANRLELMKFQREVNIDFESSSHLIHSLFNEVFDGDEDSFMTLKPEIAELLGVEK